MILASLSASISNAAFNPIALQTSSYNADVIVESNATPVLTVVTTATVDNGSNNTANTWFEIGYDTGTPGNGLPAADSVFTAQDDANYSFRMPPSYAAPNGILIDTVVTSGTFTVTTPAAYNKLSFLGSGGNGGDVIGVRVNHADGTFETGSFGCPDWFGGTGVAYTAGGRLQSPVTFTTELNAGNPRIYFRDVTLTNTTSPVTNIVLTYSSGAANSHNCILGVSGATTPGGPVGPIIVTGYTYDFICEASAPKRGRIITETILDGTNVWATSQTMDNDGNTGYCWYERGHNINMINNGPVIYGDPTVNAIARASGIPVHGTTFTNGDYSFTMAPDYAANNVVWSSPTVPNATMTLVTPTAASALSFLCAAGNGPVNPNVIIHHQDGSSQTSTITIVDWFSGITPMFIPNGRVSADTAQWSQQTLAQTGANRLFNADLLLANTTSPVTSIDLVYTNTGGRAGIFAVSGAVGAAPPIITQHPSGTNVYVGSPAGFSVVASGTSLTYQWQKGINGTFANLNNGGNISGATTANLSISPVGVSDEASYRVIVSNSGGSPASSAAVLGVFSSIADVTAPGDVITSFGISHWGDGGVINAIDNDLGAKIGGGISGSCGVVISPSMGATLVTALRVYTANDSEDRDPANYKLEGSTDGGGSYTLIASNSLALPAGRNTSGGAPDPLLQFVQEVRFPNGKGYSSYRLTFSQFKGGAGQGAFQAGELELLGVATNILSAVVPTSAKAFEGAPLNISAIVAGSPTPTVRWQKQIVGVFTDLTDGGTVSGSHTADLSINPAAFSDTALFRAIASNTSGSATSGVVQVTILTTNIDVTIPGDSVADFGNTSSTAATTDGAINNDFSSFVTRGSGLNNNAGFPPFAGPVGVVITPSLGSTIISGVRFYPGIDGVAQDPADFKLEGSSNGGASYTTLVPSTALAIPGERNALALTVDPLTTSVQEVLFANGQAYTSYRLTFNHTKDDNTASSLSLGEVELLGVAGLPVPSVSITVGAGGSLNISSTMPGTLWSNTNLTGGTWISEGPITGTVNIIPSPAQKSKFFRVVVP